MSMMVRGILPLAALAVACGGAGFTSDAADSGVSVDRESKLSDSAAQGNDAGDCDST
jgi:hypothetical protein